ncbi:hypothetical protein K435DRAFT_806576 [Dendrothele bispora CBS 962.96]|uniref:Uncharacterized protein n=1 Tax=Dendrothele bispora (strain CBS 962.96) TaxID=1314807 RepID=A0A4S8L7S7_DENBC|nr:hypothetical protein K435DRAFT_806576 [Dendrothele bispora CBS 962.96]
MSSQTQQTGPLSDPVISVIVNWAIGTALGYLVYGANIVISFTVIYLLTTTSTRMTRGQLGLLFSTIFMLLVSTLFVSLNTALMLLQIPLFAINPPDTISLRTMWRAWILYPRNLIAKIVLILCMIGSLGTFVYIGLETEKTLRDIAVGPLEMLEQILPLLTTNLVSTPMIAYKAWNKIQLLSKKYQEELDLYKRFCDENYVIGYSVIIVKGTDSQYSAFFSAMPMLSAMNPLLVVLIAAHEKSKEASNNVMSLTQSIKFASKNSKEPGIQG